MPPIISATDALKAFRQTQSQQGGSSVNLGQKLDQIWGTHSSSSIVPQPTQAAPQQNPQSTAPRDNSFLGNFGHGVLDAFGGAALGNPITQGALNGGLKSQLPFLPNAGDVVNFVADSTVKPIAKEAAGLTIAPLINAPQALYQGLKAGGPWSEKGTQAMKNQMAAPVNLPGLGNVNLLQQDQAGQASAGLSTANTVGSTLDAGSGVANLVAPELSLGENGLKGFGIAAARGAIQSGGKALQDPNATPQSVGINSALGALTSGTLSKIPGLIGGARNIGAKLSGLSDEAISTLTNPETAEQAIQGIGGAKAAKINPTGNLDPMQNVAENQFKPAVVKLAEQNKQIGAQLGDTIKNSGVKVDFSQPFQAFNDSLNKFGGELTSDGVKFGEFGKIDEPSDINQLNKVGALLDKYKDQPTDASNLHALIQKIDGMINYSSKTAVPLSDPAQSILKSVRGTASDLLKQSVPESVPLFEQFAKNHDVLDFFNPKLGDNSSSTSVLKNLFSSLRKDNALPNIQALEEATGTDILNPLRSAKTAMNIVGDTRGEQLPDVFGEGGVKKKALETLRRFILNPESRAEAISNQILGKKGLTDQAASLASKGNVVPNEIMNALRALFSSGQPSNEN